MNDFFQLIFMIVIIVLIILLNYVIRYMDKRRIKKYVTNIGGELYDIRSLAIRERIYSVQYYRNEKKETKTVKFDIINDEIWY